MKKPIALFCSDLHLTSQVPDCRDPETWIQDQEGMLNVLIDTVNGYKVPLCIAGDIFHRSKEDPIIESMIIRKLLQLDYPCYTIPGQHDMPGHSYERLNESSYDVLRATRAIHHCPAYEPLKYDCAYLCGVPYGQDISGTNWKRDNLVLMAHQMVYTLEPFPGAPESGNINSVYKQIKAFRLAVFGDNHQGFVHKKKDKMIINCGVAIQRTRAEIEYQPYAYLLYSDFSIEKIKLPTTDKFIKKVQKRSQDQFDVFISTLKEKQEVSLSFRENLKQTLTLMKADKELQDMVWDIMEECNE